jgi:hypothetical protein
VSETFFITPYTKEEASSHTASFGKHSANLHVELENFFSEFRQQWPKAHILYESDEGFGIVSEKTGFEVDLSDHQVVRFKPYSSKFVLWYRAYVTPSIKLFFSSSGSSRYLELKPETTDQELEAFFSSG